MSEKLEEIKRRWQPIIERGWPMGLTVNRMEQLQADVPWLITQAERVEELDAVNEVLRDQNLGLNRDAVRLDEENQRLREAIEDVHRESVHITSTDLVGVTNWAFEKLMDCRSECE